VTLGEFLERWLIDYRPNLSPRGFERYQGIVLRHFVPDLGRITLTQLRPEHLQKHYTAKLNHGLSARTVKYYQLARFLEAAKDTPCYALFYTALYTGMRRSEMLALRWQDVDFVYSQISVSRSLHQLRDGSYVFTEPKSVKSRRTIALPPSAALMLKKHYEAQKATRQLLGIALTDNDLVFCHEDGTPVRPNTVTRTWTTLATRAGLKVIRLHDARHSHASIMLKQGIHPKIVQERLGHSSIDITLDVYSHVAPGLQEAAARRFDDLMTSKREKEAVEKFG